MRGKYSVLAVPAELIKHTGQSNLDEAFIALLPENKRQGHKTITVPPRQQSEDRDFSQRLIKDLW
ncbi:hypothetical protein GCM10025857_67560 [Alicyclobacillus contaminans]|nr:hypothetical protein GCM10025857_67560 [Alicyclobacillus contaminans]